jgi:hypothetical protein
MIRFVPLLLVALMLSLPPAAAAQMRVEQIDDPPPLATYSELGGNAYLSFNVDMLVVPHLSIRAGGFVWPLSVGKVPWSGVLMMNRLIGTAGHYLEIGAGGAAFNWFQDYDQAATVAATATVGYRYQRDGRIARMGFTPIFAPLGGRRWQPNWGVSYGRTF